MASIEEQIEDIAKLQLDNNCKYYTKTEIINNEIEDALKKAPSKQGGKGKNFPDIKLFIQTKSMRKIPVMIEVKGTKGDLVKYNDEGNIDNLTKDGKPNYNNISKYAVNGAVHYANAILKYTSSYKEVIAIGLNGYYEGNSIKTEMKTYYISESNYMIPKEIANYEDLSFLFPSMIDELIEKIDNLFLTEKEIEEKSKEYENEIEVRLKKLNQLMQDDLQISVDSRVELVTGMIMAGLGVENRVAPLEIADLKGQISESEKDGQIILNKVKSFLSERNLPREKQDMIIDDLKQVFLYADLSIPINGESKLKSIYSVVKREIMPIFSSGKHLDFTGKLFNVLNDWVRVPDGDKNDVVLTPRYVTDLMAKIAEVNMNSYVWDFAAGSGGFLISSMRIMIDDAKKRCNSPQLLSEKIDKIKHEQLLGVEKLPDIYLLAVLNMILMGDGSSNIIHGNSLTTFDGKYEQGDLKGKDYPANVFLLNPPYSASGKGFIFVEKALNKMKNGKAAVLIQENAGCGLGLPYTKDILKNNTLLASIHMSDIFLGKSNVQTAIYLFDVGIPHNEKKPVKFIDFSNDGYTRLSRRKSSINVNLKNTDHAIERYEELVNVVLYGKSYLNLIDDNCYIEDTITLDGNDWTYLQHKKIELMPSEDEFRKTVNDFVSWRLNDILKNGGDLDDSI